MRIVSVPAVAEAGHHLLDGRFLLGAACMGTFSIILLLFAHPIARAFTPDTAVIAATIGEAIVLAIFGGLGGV